MAFGGKQKHQSVFKKKDGVVQVVHLLDSLGLRGEGHVWHFKAVVSKY